jgi:hypothetical protein
MLVKAKASQETEALLFATRALKQWRVEGKVLHPGVVRSNALPGKEARVA